MKSILAKMSLVVLSMFSFSSFAEVVTITGSPVVLEQREGVYYMPASAAATPSTTPYHYVTVDGKNRVCYLEKQPGFASLDVMTINVNVGGTTTAWNCYEYSTEYFTVVP